MRGIAEQIGRIEQDVQQFARVALDATSKRHQHDVMDLAQYVSALQEQLAVAAASGGDDALALAERLTAPLEAATRLVLLEALSAAATEISCELAPGSVDLRLRGRDPEFVVIPPPGGQVFEHEASRPSALSTQAAAGDGDEDSTARITLRLPEQLKLRMEEEANREGLSVNAWLVRAVAAALKNRGRGSGQGPPPGGEHFTGWVG